MNRLCTHRLNKQKTGSCRQVALECTTLFIPTLLVRIQSNGYDYVLDGYIVYIGNFMYSYNVLCMYTCTLYVSWPTVTNSGFLKLHLKTCLDLQFVYPELLLNACYVY